MSLPAPRSRPGSRPRSAPGSARGLALSDEPTLREVFATHVADGVASGFVLAQVPEGKPLLWVQDRLSWREGGRPYAPGLAYLAERPVEVLWLQVAKPVDVLWAMEQALGCAALGAVVGEVWGDPSALDFTASKRLALRAERAGVQAWLGRRAATPDLSAARERWRLTALPSPPESHDLRASGEPIWRAALFRARERLSGDWLARANRGRLALADHAPLDEPRRAAG